VPTYPRRAHGTVQGWADNGVGFPARSVDALHRAGGQEACFLPGPWDDAAAADSVIEALELADPDGPWIVGVQWRPEDTAGTDPVLPHLPTASSRAAHARAPPRSAAGTGNRPVRWSCC